MLKVLSVFCLISTGIILTAFGHQDRAAAGPSHRCSDAPGTTVLRAEGVRLFRVAGRDARTNVRVCLMPNGISHLLGPRLEAGLWSASMPGPFAIHRPWVAGIENHQIGQDTVELVARRWRFRPSNKPSLCSIGLANRPGQVPQVQKFFVTEHGTLAWASSLKAQGTNKLAVCSGRRSRTLAEGHGLELSSVRLDSGHVLRWVDEAGTHSLNLR